MLARILLNVLLLAAVPAWPQVVPSATGGGAGSQMMTPASVSGTAYPSEVGADVRANYLRGGINFRTSYIDNLYAGSGENAVGEMTYSISPIISFDQTRERQHLTFTYSPGFMFYRPSSSLDEDDQNLLAAFNFRVARHVSLGVNESFQKSSTAFGLTDSVTGGTVSGSPQTMLPGVLAPFAERLTNTVEAHLSFQLSPVDMIGVSGSTMLLDYPNSADSTGLYDSNQRGGGVFYNRRLSATQYIGVNYLYSHVTANPEGAQSTTQTQTIDAFYSIFIRQNLSISVSGGPQSFSVTQTALPSSESWTPSFTASMGWQAMRTNFAVSYSKSVTGGGGLLGAFDSTSSAASARWKISQSWTGGASANYAINKSAVPLILDGGIQGGHTIAGSATVSHDIRKELSASFEYDRIHQSYIGIAAIAGNPNSDRVMISLGWQFMRPLGR